MSSGSSVDRHSNNVSLFGLVEQINVRPEVLGAESRPIPVEVHAYFQLEAGKTESNFEMRLVLVADTGLETLGDVFRSRAKGPRLRVRTLGLPLPPVPGQYSVRVDLRLIDEGGAEAPWERQAVAWPVSLREIAPRPQVTH